jgi:hypothetical protein
VFRCPTDNHTALLENRVLTIIFFSSFFIHDVTSSLDLLKAYFGHYNSLFTLFKTCSILCHTYPRYLNIFSCSTSFASMLISTVLQSWETQIAFLLLLFAFLSYFFAVSFNASITVSPRDEYDIGLCTLSVGLYTKFCGELHIFRLAAILLTVRYVHVLPIACYTSTIVLQ